MAERDKAYLKKPESSKYSAATRERAVRLVLENRERFRHDLECIKAVAGELGMHPNTLRGWVRQARIEIGELEPLDTRDQEIAALKRENAELAKTVAILKAATSFFARECDPLNPLSAGSSSSTEQSSESHRSAES